MLVLHIFLLGCGILVGALALNGVASLLGLMSWYEFIKAPGQAGGVSLVWLFVLYPLGLGCAGYISAKLIGLI